MFFSFHQIPCSPGPFLSFKNTIGNGICSEINHMREARANNEARTELESCLRKARDREATLVQTLEELRQTRSRTEQQAVFREDMVRRDINDLQRLGDDLARNQASPPIWQFFKTIHLKANC